MEHDEAIAAVAAERYILGELSETERDGFEEHYFSCPVCAEDVRDLARLTAGVKAGLGETPAEAKRQEKQRAFAPLDTIRAWLARPVAGWAAACAMALLATSVSVRTVALRTQLRPEAVHAWVLHPETRGETIAIPAERVGQFLLLEFDLPGAGGMLDWVLLRADSNTVVDRGSVAAPSPGASLKLVLPNTKLEPAEYRVDVSQAALTPSTWSFRFRITGGS